jgi:hypothetical protein
VAGLTAKRVFLADVRGNDHYLRVTWHPETAVLVVSHWEGQVCVASTPVALVDASTLLDLLVTSMQEVDGGGGDVSPRAAVSAGADHREP